MMIFIGIYTGVIGYVEIEYWKLSQNNNLKNSTIKHEMLSFIISLLLGYRTKTACDS
jgi:putative membrane protein